MKNLFVVFLFITAVVVVNANPAHIDVVVKVDSIPQSFEDLGGCKPWNCQSHCREEGYVTGQCVADRCHCEQ